ncbi:hypothetical protein CSKR_111231 [Clonorchis sinensis]|uniref:Uncharacterized protein n=1 Tax=Clonorchis sinensis TaxID=79923 RepID=A0A8T1MSL2_CLOSI|nr:hypothetical protein CSKR_111231 [Clonorchis sinensis]
MWLVVGLSLLAVSGTSNNVHPKVGTPHSCFVSVYSRLNVHVRSHDDLAFYECLESCTIKGWILAEATLCWVECLRAAKDSCWEGCDDPQDSKCGEQCENRYKINMIHEIGKPPE